MRQVSHTTETLLSKLNCDLLGRVPFPRGRIVGLFHCMNLTHHWR